MASVKLIVGLGNPGAEYEFSPHNMGFAVVERLASRHSVRLTRRQWQSLCGKLEMSGREGDRGEASALWLIQPQTFMNLSGAAVKDWLVKTGSTPEEMLVIYDELDLPWGSIRIRPRGGSAGHHGLESIIGSIASPDFPRLRIGVAPERRGVDSVDYLLSPVKRSQRAEMDEIIGRAADAVETILKHGVVKAMNQFNKRAPGAEPDPGEDKN
jgi:PTH1 family peptidyl-tRNA hydrolase